MNPRQFPSASRRAMARGAALALVLVAGLLASLLGPPLPSRRMSAQAAAGLLDCDAVLESELTELQNQVARAARLLREGVGHAPIVYLIGTHANMTPDEVRSTGEPLQQVATEAMAARITGSTLGEVRARVAAGESVQQIIVGSGVEVQVALFPSTSSTRR